MTTFRPLKNRLLVSVDEPPEKTRAGILLIRQDENIPVEATVIAIGEMEHVKVNVGDRILMKKAAGIEVTLDGEKFSIVSDDLILGVSNV